MFRFGIFGLKCFSFEIWLVWLLVSHFSLSASAGYVIQSRHKVAKFYSLVLRNTSVASKSVHFLSFVDQLKYKTQFTFEEKDK